MPNMTILQANVAAALDKKELSMGDRYRLQQYARQTAPGYCAGCSQICESATDLDVPISDILRYSMYYNSYKERDTALRLFDSLSPDVKSNILEADYSIAEKRCPQKIQIGRVLKKAYEDFS
jgi:predicted aldo/keto reductase-like oxidoreductase